MAEEHYEDHDSSKNEILTDSDFQYYFEKSYLEIGNSAIWTVSSAREEFGVSLLRGNSLHENSYWQSDGALPHRVSIQFPSLTPVSCVAIFLNFTADESYTPRKLSVEYGTHPADGTEAIVSTVVKPNGWLMLDLSGDEKGNADDVAILEKVRDTVWCNYITVIITENHQSGRDTRVRAIRVFTPHPPITQYKTNEEYNIIR
eukprot:Tbor_TRINITY_DN3522_c0_g1::TRINITY_DN3522_c0_g1_i2::g.2934::m.2934/K03357/APC10, DOC1; anaphase-promoting complex subunit 10